MTEVLLINIMINQERMLQLEAEESRKITTELIENSQSNSRLWQPKPQIKQRQVAELAEQEGRICF